MTQDDTVASFENVAAITAAMRDAARDGNWDDLISLEARCARAVETLRQQAGVPLPADAREHKVRILRQILEHDREIRSFTTPWMSRLAALIGSAGTERKLARAYGA